MADAIWRLAIDGVVDPVRAAGTRSAIQNEVETTSCEGHRTSGRNPDTPYDNRHRCATPGADRAGCLGLVGERI